MFPLDLSGEQLEFPAYELDGHLVWGLTERILTSFLALLETGREA